MTPAKDTHAEALSRKVLKAFDDLNGSHPGFRPAHAKGILISGTFTPSASGSSLSRAPHLHRPSTPVTVRFSDFAGIPSIPDSSADASPRGMAIRFHLGEHTHTDIVAHSVDGFPARTTEEFVEFLEAIYASATATTKPTPIEAFLRSHPSALEFVQAPKPIPTSFAREAYFGVSAYRFTNEHGIGHFGRYRIVPIEGADYLTADAAAAKPANFLIDEIQERVGRGTAKFRIVLQIGADGDVSNDATIHWPEDRQQIEFGTIELTGVVANNAEEQRQIIFDPVPRVDGITASEDPLLEPRADVYVMSGRRRRAAV